MKMKLSIFTLCFISLLPALDCFGGKSEPFVAEAKNFYLICKDTSPELQKCGISSGYLKEYAELCCRRSELPIKGSKEGSFLVINVTALPVFVGGQSLGFAIAIEMDFYQFGKTTITEEWSIITSWTSPTTLLLAEQDSVKSKIKENIKDKIETFENVWGASHPASKETNEPVEPAVKTPSNSVNSVSTEAHP